MQTAVIVSVTFAATPEVTAPRAMVVASSGEGVAEAGLELLRRVGTAMDAVLGFGATGIGSMTRSIAALSSVLGRGSTPQEAVDKPALGGFEFSPGPPPSVLATVGGGEFTESYLESLRDLGQPSRISNSARGYWLGIAIEPVSGMRRAGMMREVPQLGGGAAGY